MTNICLKLQKLQYFCEREGWEACKKNPPQQQYSPALEKEVQPNQMGIPILTDFANSGRRISSNFYG